MKLSVENMYGFNRLEENIPHGATLVTGVNATGKSNLARILGALVAMEDNPEHFDMTWKKWYMRENAQSGFAKLDDVKWTPGSAGGISAPAGVKAMAHPHAVGLIDFVNSQRVVRQRTAVWEGLIMPDNPRVLIEPAWPIKDRGKMEKVIELIEQHSWQDACKVYEDQRKDLKRRWHEVTGEAYGVKKANNWKPKHWHPDLDSMSHADVMAEMVNAKDDLTAMTTAQAVSATQVEEARHVRDVLLPEAEEELQALLTKLDKTKAKMEELAILSRDKQEKINKVDQFVRRMNQIIESSPAVHCPSCSTGLEYDADGNLSVWQKPDADTLSQAVSQKDTVLERVKPLIEEKEHITAELKDLTEYGHDLTQKKDRLSGRIEVMRSQAAYADKTPTEETSYDKRSEAEKTLEVARQKFEAYEALQQANEFNKAINAVDQICQILGTSGVRTQHLDSVIDGMKEQLREMTALAGWHDIDLTHDYMLTVNGKPVVVCAESEKLKAQWSMQFLSAIYAKEKWVILDQADTLVDAWWEGLVTLVNELCSKDKELRVIVCGSQLKVDGWNRIELAR